MDKNNATGLLLISLLLLTYFLFFSPDPAQFQQEQAEEQAAAAQENAGPASQPEQVEVLSDSLMAVRFGFFARGMQGNAREVVLENPDVRITFSSHGGKIESVVLKNYVTYTREVLELIDKDRNRMQETLDTRNGKIVLQDLYYEVKQAGQSVSFVLASPEGGELKRTFTLAAEGFTLDYEMAMQGLNQVVLGDAVQFYWYNRMPMVEKDLQQTRNQSTVNFYQPNGNFDYLTEASTDDQSKQVEGSALWVAMKQKFFNTGIITNGGFNQISISTRVDQQDPSTVKVAEMSLAIPLAALKPNGEGVKFYFGPNDYDICSLVAPEYQKNVYLGWPIFSSINRFVIIPLFQFLERFTNNYGVIILILVFVVKTILFPLTYKSYMSMAKMRVLKPELDELKEQYGDDMTKMQQEQMKLYSRVGVSPLSGCIPVLLQMPVFIAMFNFFPNAIQLRQQSFLWADDLSSYDSILDLPFTIPFYGDHVSLFCLLMTLSQILYTYYNNQLNPVANQGPVNMQVIAYTTPVIMLFFLNSFSSGLTYYYFISNLITIGQQLAIKGFVNEEKIRAILEENKKRNSNKKKSKFQQRLEDALKAQEEGLQPKTSPKPQGGIKPKKKKG
jgi:YidC/Oxa1 family membrane protein insertase